MKSSRYSGITLIEILVSITIIAVLAAIGSAVYSASVKRAHQAGCLSNLRQVGMALLSYAAENDQMGPYDAREAGNLSISLTKYQGKPVTFGPLLPYLGAADAVFTPKILICPGASPRMKATLSGSYDNTSYWMNPDISSNPDKTQYIRLTSLPRGRVAILDSCTWWHPGEFGSDYDNHGSEGISVFRLEGSASWIPSRETIGLPAWDWEHLDSL